MSGSSGGRTGVAAGVGVAVLLGAACAVVLWELWHGPVLLPLSVHHGVDAGDLPALPLLALAVALIRRRYLQSSAAGTQAKK
jgi:hypothetical protein